MLYDNVVEHDILTALLIRALDFEKLTKGQSPDRKVLVMAAAPKEQTNHWLQYRCDRHELPDRVRDLLSKLGKDPTSA